LDEEQVMPPYRHTIPVATSALFFVCLMLHAQAGVSPQAFTPYNDVEAYKVYESLLPGNWTVTAARARRLLQAQAGSTVRLRPALRPASESASLLHPLFGSFHSFAVLNQTNWLLEPRFNLGAKNMRWRCTSRAWAS
jgi:hypothetical protein